MSEATADPRDAQDPKTGRETPPKGGAAEGSEANASSTAAVAAPSAVSRTSDSLGFVMDVPVDLTIELGRKKTRIGDILRLGPGSVVELDKGNGEPLDIFVNNRLIARGEAVVVGERYGVRLTEVLAAEDHNYKKGSQK